MKRRCVRSWMRWGRYGMLLVALALTGCGDRKNSQGSGTTPAPSGSTSSSVTPEAIEAALGAAESYLAAGHIPEAQTIAAELVEKAPSQWKAHELYGRILYLRASQAKRDARAAEAKDLTRQAYEQYRTAAELSPDSAGLQHSAGMMALAAGDDSAALAHLRQAERLDLRNPQYPLHEAQILIMNKSLDEAEAALARVLAIDGDEPFAHASLAAISVERGQMDKAIEQITRARSIDSSNVALRIQEAKIRRRAGQPRQALELLVGLKEADRSGEAAASEIAASYALLGNHANAAMAWALCYRHDDRSWRAALHAAQEYRAAGDQSQAASWLQIAQNLAPDEEEVKAEMTNDE